MIIELVLYISIGIIMSLGIGVAVTEFVDRQNNPLPPKLNHGDLVTLSPWIKYNLSFYLGYGSRSRNRLLKAFAAGPQEIIWIYPQNLTYALRDYKTPVPESWLVCQFKRE
jgi:hypothetical protein